MNPELATNRARAQAVGWLQAAVAIVVGGLSWFGGAASAFGADSTPKRPNVVMILADDMGFSDAGCYGGEIATPNLDALAAGGLRFTQFYNTARCWPTRGALMTGYYAQAIRRDVIPGLNSPGKRNRPAWAPLLPALLRPLGYRSYHSGKWHIDGPMLPAGFDHSYSVEDHNHFFGQKGNTEDDKPTPPIPSGDTYYATTAIADHAIKCLKEHAQEFGDKPFFQYLAFISPHFPLQASQADIDRYRGKYARGWDVVQTERGQKLKELGIVSHDPPAIERDLGPPYAFPADIAKLGPGEVNRPLPWTELNDVQREFQATKMAIHAAMIDRMDREIGRVIEQLKAMNQFENTLILFASDNGASAEIMVRGDGHDLKAPMGSAATFLCLGPGWSSAANTPFRRHKTWVHEGGISTPLIAHWPKGIKARGELRHNPGHVVDIVPTVVELAGGEMPKVWNERAVPASSGKSLAPVFAKDNTALHNDLWWLHEGNRAIRSGDWKLVSTKPGNEWELYDLSHDRGESHNLASAEPERVKQMAAQWEQRLEAFRELVKADDATLPPDAAPVKKKKAK